MANAETRLMESLTRFAKDSEALLATGASVMDVEELLFGPLDMPAGFPVELAFHNPMLGC